MTRELTQRMNGERVASAPVVIGSGILDSIADRVRSIGAGKNPSSILLVVDDAIATTWGARVARSWHNPDGSSVRVTECLVHASESNKSASTWTTIMDQAIRAGLDRRGVIVAVGGGITTDLAGFCAATYLRGVQWIAVPTTLLGMVDAALGGKTGINLSIGQNRLGKNLAGTIWPPSAVIADTQTLTSLSARTFRGGLAECLKHSMIADPSIAALLANAQTYFADPDPLNQWRLIDLVARCAQVKLDIVAEDPREADRRMLLNLGHTFAHALESEFAAELLHGEAVALGLVAASFASVADGGMTLAQAQSVRSQVAGLGFAVALPRAVTVDSLEFAAGFDKKREESSLTLILPVGSGGARIVRRADPELLRVGLRAIGAVESAGH